jgi:hypothetical protein
MSLQRATRQGVRPLIAFYSESGCGKTYSALLLARGFVGPQGKIGMIDSESGRGSLYADVIPGGYDVLQLTEPFSPQRYIQAVQVVEKSGAAIGIIDSASHEWENTGGVLDMAAVNEEKSGKSLNVWRLPKLEHAKFMLKLLQSPIPWIICLRAKYKTRQGKNAQGKTEIVKDDFTTPIQAEDCIYEMTAHGEIMPDHSLRLTKWSHPALKSCFPSKGPVTIEHGALVRQWCDTPGGTPPEKPSGKPAKTAVDELKKKLWDLCIGRVGTTRPTIETRLREWSILMPNETLSDLTTETALQDAINKVEIQLTPD